MIRYSLRCDAGHEFESWFADAAACDDLFASGRVNCPFCGSVQVEKALMVPSVRSGRKAAAARDAAHAGEGGAARSDQAVTAAQPAKPDSATPAPAADLRELEKALKAMRREIESNSEYVGMNFASEARRIHEGDAPPRPIYGEAPLEEARKLIEEGVPVAPLPFVPRRKVN